MGPATRFEGGDLPGPAAPDTINIGDFIRRWENSGAAERAGAGLFATE